MENRAESAHNQVTDIEFTKCLQHSIGDEVWLVAHVVWLSVGLAKRRALMVSRKVLRSATLLMGVPSAAIVTSSEVGGSEQ
ncbi:MAG: hypothetical protein EB027_03745 [Actinobacteria bacterium]|nr:hypothetical protein [Actinomycetota bacterium]